MPVIAIQGIRGGCGTTTVAAGLAATLQAMDYPVLLWDLSPHNLLGQHVGLGFHISTGWAQAITDQRPWYQAAFATGYPNLLLLPFGRPTNFAALDTLPSTWLQQAVSSLALDRRTWIILDIPRYPLTFAQQAHDIADLWLHVTEADPACHALMYSAAHPAEMLTQQQVTPDAAALGHHYWLVNRHHTYPQLSRDIWQLWQTTLGNKLVPGAIHQDEAIREALATKQLITDFAPQSLAAQDFLSLATWCKKRVELGS